MTYDPLTDLDGRAWLASSEDERLEAVVDCHRRHKMKLPSVRLHAALHVTIENQIAEQYGPPCKAVGRLVAEGLDRHEAIHAIASVATEQFRRLMQGHARQFDHTAYERELAALTADGWKKIAE